MFFFISTLLLLFIIFYNSNTFIFSISKTQVLKAILPILIIIGHCSLNYNILYDFKNLGAIVVSIFFFISGYGLELKRLQQKISIGYILRRIKKILLPIIIPSIIYITVLYIKGDNVSETLLKNIWRWNIVLPYTWFISKLLIIYLLFYISTLLKRPTIVFITSLILFDFICVLLKAPGHSYLSDFGFIYGILFHRLHFLNNHKLRFVFIITNFLLIFSLMQYAHNGATFFILISLFTILSSIIVTILPERRPIKFFSKLSDISYEIYLCQGISFLIFSESRFNLYIKATLILITSLLLAYFVKSLTNKILLTKY